MNLSDNIDFDIKRFFQWWGRELDFFVPELFKRLISDKSGYVFLTLTEQTLTFTKIRDNQTPLLKEINLDDSRLEQYQQLLQQERELDNVNYVLRLSAGQALKKILYLPVAAKENLLQVVAFEMDKYTPFTEEQVCYAVKVLEKEQNGQIKVLLVLTPKETVEPFFVQLKQLGIHLTAVDYQPVKNDFVEDLDAYNLLPDTEKPQKNKITVIVSVLLTTLLFTLMAVVLVFPIWQKGQAVDALREQLSRLEKEAKGVQSQQQEIDQIVEETARLLKVKTASPSALGLINDMTQLMPDDTWLSSFVYRDKGLKVRGQSASAPALIGLLEASPVLSEVKFISPLTPDKKTGTERFQIQLTVKTEGDIEDE